MGKDEISMLKMENNHLQYLANHDELTGVLNRRAVEKRIRERLSRGGILLVCDLDEFKKINDRYGHMLGDRYLCDAARLLGFFLRSPDLLGRIGGDEFVMFFAENPTEERMKGLISKIENRFLAYSRDTDVPIGISIGGAICQPDDTFETLFRRADQELLIIKDIRHKRQGRLVGSSDNWDMDMQTINHELTENIKRGGAQCHDFQTFKNICYFIERCIGRDDRKACVVLMSLIDIGDKSCVPFDIQRQMEILAGIIRRTLRRGDVYTRYSSCQFLILLVDADKEKAEVVEARIEKFFREKSSEDRLVFHCCYELQEAKIEKKADVSDSDVSKVTGFRKTDESSLSTLPMVIISG